MVKRVFISIDMEGISGIVDWSEVDRNNSEYVFARKLMAGDLNAAIKGALDAGVKEIVVSDAHGGMRNLRPEEVHEAAHLVRGSPKPGAMMEGIDDTFDAAMYVGYHSMKGTSNGIMCHTISGRAIDGIWINSRETGEFGLNSGTAGVHGVPSVFLAGDYAATVEANAFVPGITTAAVKWAVGRYSAKCLHPNESTKLITAKVKEALTKPLPEPRVVNEPVEVKLLFNTSTMCDLASLMPSFERIDGRNMKGNFNDYKTAINAMRAAIYLAGAAERR
ncbi:MAG: M55 family metallopeptidase [Candidatus Bathyarchaeota archaeon]|nr:M55 family metallopeptidase [Candidatus Bathyarchaeota archaeon]